MLTIDQITEMLLRIAVHADMPPPSARSIFAEASPPLTTDKSRDSECWAYKDLVKEGGRPVYHLDHLEDIAAEPERFRSLLRPWITCPDTTHPPDWCQVFEKQLKRWRDFRRWQKDNRNLPDFTDSFEHFLEKTRLQHRRDKAHHLLYSLEQDPDSVKAVWEDDQFYRVNRRKIVREIAGHHGFRDYVEALTYRLTRHGLEMTVTISEHPAFQGELTEWFEYLGFELWWLDRYEFETERLRPAMEQDWRKLQEDGVVGQYESPDSIQVPERQCDRRTTIGDFFNKHRSFRQQRRNAVCHKFLVKWVKSQIPIIEGELEHAPEAQPRYPGPRGRPGLFTQHVSSTFTRQGPSSRPRLNMTRLRPRTPEGPSTEHRRDGTNEHVSG